MSLWTETDRPMRTRPCAVAGRFYPSDPETLRRDLGQYLATVDLDEACVSLTETRPIRAIIAPHAGYIYSAPIAASAYARIAEGRRNIRRVVLIGPSHYVGFRGLACSSAEAFASPFGNIPVDTEATQKLLSRKFVCCYDQAHAPEHGLEVHLPFLIHTLRDTAMQQTEGGETSFLIVPLLFGDVGYNSVADILDEFLDDSATLIVVSSDLSHYHDYDSAKRIDRTTADAIVARQCDAITSDRACGHTAIQAILRCAEGRKFDVAEVDLRNSGDTAGPRDRVVGYGAFVIR